MLHTLKPSRGSRKAKKRLGRGNAGKGGTTAGKGTKGQKARSGGWKGGSFEGGQTPLLLRLPKAGGFRNPTRVEYEIVNLRDLERLPEGSYDIAALREHRLVHGGRPVKILGMGKVTKRLELTVDAVSAGAKEAIEKAGGKITLV